jgi:hypothetical protein
MLPMTNDSTEEKIKEKVMGTKEKVKETIGMGESEKKEPSSDSPTKKVEGPGKALGKEEGSE